MVSSINLVGDVSLPFVSEEVLGRIFVVDEAVADVNTFPSGVVLLLNCAASHLYLEQTMTVGNLDSKVLFSG